MKEKERKSRLSWPKGLASDIGSPVPRPTLGAAPRAAGQVPPLKRSGSEAVKINPGLETPMLSSSSRVTGELVLLPCLRGKVDQDYIPPSSELQAAPVARERAGSPEALHGAGDRDLGPDSRLPQSAGLKTGLIKLGPSLRAWVRTRVMTLFSR